MKKLIAITLVALSLIIVNCKDKSTDDPEPTPEKTLNKSLLPNKYWESSQKGFYFRSDGKYCNTAGTNVLGTWQWLNNSDSLEINYSTGPDELWYFKYITETELSAKPGYNGGYIIFTKQ